MKIKNLNQITDFDIKLLRIFKTVCECGSFTSAESVLGISRSAISLHMSDLENRLGLRLCQRGRAGSDRACRAVAAGAGCHSYCSKNGAANA